MNPTPEEYQRGLDKLKEFRAIPVDDLEYHGRVAALKKKRDEEKARIPDVLRDPSKEYRWCDPRSERFPYLVVAGWIPVTQQGRLVCDNELILCSKDRTVDCGRAEVADFNRLVDKGEG